MSDDRSAPLLTESSSTPPRSGSPTGLWRHRLRGRVRYAALLGVLAAIAGGVIGWFVERPTFEATASLTATAAPGSDLDTIAALAERAAQHTAARSIAEFAMSDLTAPAADERDTWNLQRLLDARHVAIIEASTGRIVVRVEAHDPVQAQRAAAALAKSATATYQLATLADLESLNAAQTMHKGLALALGDVNAKRDALLASVGPIPLDDLYSSKLTQLDTVNAELTRARIAQSDADSAPKPPAEPIDAEADAARLALFDGRLASLLLKRGEIQRRIEQLAEQLGDNDPKVEDTRIDLAIVGQQIVERVRIVHAAEDEKTVDHAARIERLTTMRDGLKDELTALADQRQNLGGFDAQIASLNEQIASNDAAIAASTAKVTAFGDLVATTDAALPSTPVLDRRPLTAAIGACGGFAIGALLAIIVIVCDQRMLRPIDNQLLGTVPAITPDQQSPQDADLTALSIHQIRATLEVRAKLRDERAFAITSASTGAGKTSLTVGLASSLALSGTRTLLVDCELAGRALSDDPQRPNDQTLDEVMVHMGYLDQREADLFVYSDDESVGLLGVLHGRPVSECVVQSTIEGLAVLPALAANAKDIGRLSGKSIRRIIDEAAGDYDMVLFDTGPIPGSIEAMLVASEADGVVVVTSRGESQSRFNKTLSYLEAAEATLAGTVFNRAQPEDLSIHVESGKKNSGGAKPQRMPFGAHATRRLPPPPGMGSGILAAAVQAQARSETKPDAPEPETRPAPSPQPTPRERTVTARPTPQPKKQDAPKRADSPTEITLSDAGDIAAILDDAAIIAEASSDKDMTEEALEALLVKKTDTAPRANHATPRDKDGKPVPNSATPKPILDPDDGLGDALDELLGDLSGKPSADSRPEIHVNPTSPSSSKPKT